MEQLIANSDSVILILLSISGLLFFVSIISRLSELREQVLGFRRMQGIIVELERTVNELQAEVRRTLIIQKSESQELTKQQENTKNILVAAGASEKTGSKVAEAIVNEPTGVVQQPSFSFGLAKSRKSFLEKLRGLFGASTNSANTISAEILEDLEVQLLSADLGPVIVSRLKQSVQSQIASGALIDSTNVQKLFADEIEKILQVHNQVQNLEERSENPLVLLIVGVNGVGKTTTCAKLARRYSLKGKKVLLVAADTFRAAAVEQLKIWGERLNVPVCAGAENAKPQTVVFEASERAVKENFDVVIIDTAGRLHNKANLMQELEGIKNAIARHITDAPHETLLVLDGTTGQNAMQQAKEFNEAVKLTGVVVTKLDGTSKGGIVIAVSNSYNLPIRYVGLGERQEDLVAFDYKEFSKALFVDNE